MVILEVREPMMVTASKKIDPMKLSLVSGFPNNNAVVIQKILKLFSLTNVNSELWVNLIESQKWKQRVSPVLGNPPDMKKVLW